MKWNESHNYWKHNRTKSIGHIKNVLWGIFITPSAYIQKSERSQINDLMMKLKTLEKQEQTKPKLVCSCTL